MTHPAMRRPSVQLCSNRAAACLLSGLLACTPFEDGQDELGEELSTGFGAANPAQGSTLTATSPTAGTDWSCLGAVVPTPPPSAVAAARRVYSLQVLDIATLRPGSGIFVRACGLTDLECEQPLSEPVAVRPDGWVDMPLFEGFTGYLEITGPEVLPGVVVLSDPLTEDSAPGYPYLILSAAVLGALGRAVNVPVDPAMGLVSIRAFDCQGVTAPGVKLTKLGPGAPWYFVSGLPSAVEQETGPDGFGGFANSPPGLAQVDALTSEGLSISGVLNMMVRPGWVSHAFVHPAHSR